MKLPQTFKVLQNRIFTRIYIAQAISLAGDAFTWVGLALVAFQLKGNDSGIVLAIALTIRVASYFLIAPGAGVMADRYDRKKIMVISHIGRMVAVGLLPFITEIWQIYVLVLILNIFNAIFYPAYKAALVVSVENKKDFPLANSLSSGTFELLGVLGPGVAGGAAAFMGARNIFFVDAISFFLAGLLIFFLPSKLNAEGNDDKTADTSGHGWQGVKKGTADLFGDKKIRFAIAMNFASAIVGAQVLVNTVGYIKGVLQLGDVQYGWVMSAFGLGATIAAFTTGSLTRKISNSRVILLGALIIGIALIPGGFVYILPLMVLWFLIGMGQSFVEIPAQNLIAERIPEENQGKVYGAHFAWSHLWWAIAYPAAGLFSKYFGSKTFFYGGIVSLGCTIIFYLIFYRQASKSE